MKYGASLFSFFHPFDGEEGKADHTSNSEGYIPKRPDWGDFSYADIERSASDLAKRPSEKSASNRDSNGSVKSNDSSKIKGDL